MAGPASRKELSHERIVDAAARAIRREGYAGVGVADVMKEAGLTHGGFYAHFPSRDAMLVAAMERAGLTQGYHSALRSGYWPSEDVLPPELRRAALASG